MLKQEKKALWDYLTAHSNIPIGFFAGTDTEEGFKITLKDSPMSFLITEDRLHAGWYECASTKFAANYPMAAQPHVVRHWLFRGRASYNLEEICRLLDRWVFTDLARYWNEQGTPDVWKTFSSDSSFFNDDTLRDDVTFTPEEKQEAAASVKEFRRLLVANFEPKTDQLRKVDEKLDYLVGALDRLSKRDWKNVALSIVIAIGINLTVDTEKGRLIFQLFEQAFGHAVKLLHG